MRTNWLLVSLVAILVLPQLVGAQEANPTNVAPTPADAPGAVVDKIPPPPTAQEQMDVPAESIPPGRSMPDPGEKARVPVAKTPRIQLPNHPLSFVDVVVLTHQGVRDDSILQLIRQYGIQRPLGASEVVSLHREGVSDAVIIALQQCPGPVVTPAATVVASPTAVVPPTVVVPVPVYPRPVVIQEYRYVPPPVRFYYSYPPPYHHHHGLGWGISIYGP
jgi:hypothetical protein